MAQQIDPTQLHWLVTALVDEFGTGYAATDTFLEAAVNAGVAPDLDAAYALAIMDRQGAPEGQVDAAMDWHWSRWSAARATAEWQARQASGKPERYRGNHR